MTCILGFADGEDSFLASDCQVSDVYNWNKLKLRDSKIFKKDDMIIGFSGSLMIGQIIKYAMDVPGKFDDDGKMQIMPYFMKKFIPNLQNLLSNHRQLRKEDEVASMNGTLIIGTEGRMFEIGHYFSVLEICTYSPLFGSMAIGSGGSKSEALFMNNIPILRKKLQDVTSFEDRKRLVHECFVNILSKIGELDCGVDVSSIDFLSSRDEEPTRLTLSESSVTKNYS